MTEGSDPTPGTSVVGAARQRLQRAVATLLVAVLPWLVAPGLLQPDTKSDLVLSPGRYLGRALWAWNDHTGIGELQNQAYGYLWPMGPIFLAGDTVGLPGWATQRVWWMLILVVSFVGAERLARRVGGLPTVPALLVGAVFALSPRVLTVLSEISVEVWPQALAPWLVLVAARGVAPGGRPSHRRRMAVATGLLAASLGGVNATVSLVALVPAAAWIMLSPGGRRRGRALAWWCLGAGLGSAWWLGPLLVLGRYSYPFLDHIELASTTTAVASVTNVLRGANHWIAYILTDGDHPTWQSGWLLAQSLTGILATTTVAGLGLAGLVRRRSGHDDACDGPAAAEGRHLTRWALVLVLVGVVVMAAGRSGSASGPLASTVQGWLDGPLAPFRNVHKADLLIRLPIAIGVGLLAHWATRVERGAGALARQVVVVGTVLALVGSLAPLWASRVGDAWAADGVPTVWQGVAAEVDEMAAVDGGSTLVLPGARTADFTWGRLTDEPLTALASSPVLVRAAAPLGHPGATRILDGLDDLTATGRSQPQLAAGLRRLGVSRVVVRGGLDPDVGAADSRQVAATFAASPGVSLASSVGEGADRISVWRLDEPAEPVALVPSQGVIPVAGAPEAWFALVASGLLDPDAVTTLSDGSGADIRTDTLRWQALNSGRPPARGHGPTLPAGDRRPAVVGTRDLQPGGADTARTTRFYQGLDGLHTSSSAADPFAPAWLGAGSGPAAMLDGDSRTAWVSGDGSPAQTITLDLPAGSRPNAVLVHEAWGGDIGRLAAVEVDGSVGHLPDGSMTWRVSLDGRERSSLTISLTGQPPGEGEDPPAIGVREVELEGGPSLSTGLTAPAGPGPVLLTRDPRGAVRPGLGEDPSDLVRRVGPLPATRVAASVRVRTDESGQAVVSAPWSLSGSTPPDDSETARGLTAWPVAAVDGDPSTRWRPSAGAAEPVLAIDLGEETQVGTITLDRAVGPVTVATDTARYVLASGTTLQIPPQRTRSISLSFTRPPGRAAWSAPEVRLAGLAGPTQSLTLPCSGAGEVGRDDGRIGLSLTAARRSLIAGDPVAATACGDLPAGDGRISARAVAGLVPQSVSLVPTGWTRAEVAVDRTVTSHRDHVGRWVFDVGSGERSVLALSQGANAGWRATDEQGHRLEPVTVDGWRQAFVMPAGSRSRVLVEFAPNTQHRLALAGGALLIGVLCLWALLELLLGRRGRIAGTIASDQEPEEVTDAASTAPRPSRGRGLWMVALLGAAAVGLLVAGPAGMLVATVGALVSARHRALAVALVLSGAGVVLAVLGVADRQSTGSLASQLLGALTLGVLVAALVRPSRGGPEPGPDSPAAPTTGDPDPC
ncbi:alpha-(1-_3)-arabinofuranosyltransferase domain-containing protein [Janibacter limosus]|uniref:alpha-(1->3)-arabinofuranosyltransferase domain-containing protein n=1 Tax=Janibacter limosus TaxID=53458 RepID=UPI00082B1B47|nr:alpha-(1->3)-arabinofuranosyltransferase family protein [Janibacter limosus]